MMNTLFNSREFVPRDLEAVYHTVNGLTETKRVPFDDLTDLARTLEDLPERDKLPQVLEQFLYNIGWPLGFRHIRPHRECPFLRLTILLAGVSALSALLATLPERNRSDILSSVESFITVNIFFLFALVGFIVASALIIYAITYAVSILDVRRYWPA